MKELLYFGAEWCAACKALWPTVEKEAPVKGYDVKYLDLDSDEGIDASEEYRVKSLPTIVIKENGVVIKRATGSTAWAEVQE